MEFTINDLGTLREAVFEARTKWYDIGLMLKVPVDELDSIDCRFDDPSDQLRETLKIWLRTARKPTWQAILVALRNRTVGQPKLANEIEAKNCTARLDSQQQQVTHEVSEAQLQQLQTRIQPQELQMKQDQQLTSSRLQIQHLTHRLKEKQRTIHIKDTQLQQQHQQLQTLEQNLLQYKLIILEFRVANDQLSRKLQQAVEEKQHTIKSIEGQLHELHQQLQAR